HGVARGLLQPNGEGGSVAELVGAADTEGRDRTLTLALIDVRVLLEREALVLEARREGEGISNGVVGARVNGQQTVEDDANRDAVPLVRVRIVRVEGGVLIGDALNGRLDREDIS